MYPNTEHHDGTSKSYRAMTDISLNLEGFSVAMAIKKALIIIFSESCSFFPALYVVKSHMNRSQTWSEKSSLNLHNQEKMSL